MSKAQRADLNVRCPRSGHRPAAHHLNWVILDSDMEAEFCRMLAAVAP